MVPLLLAFALQAAAPPSAEALDLGRRLAAHGGLATMVPMLVERDIGELVKDNAALNAADQARLAEAGRAEGRAGLERMIGAMGQAYAERLSVADLKVLVAAAERPEAARLRAAEPAAVMATVQAMGDFDLKKRAKGRFCAETGKLCGK